MNKYVKYPLVLGLVALISGALLSGTYHLTKEKIEQGRIDRQTSAINDMFATITRKELIEESVKLSHEVQDKYNAFVNISEILCTKLCILYN